MSDPCSRKGNLNSDSLNLLSLAKVQTGMTLLQKASHPILTSAYGLNWQAPDKWQRPCNISTTLYNSRKKRTLDN